MSHYVQVGVASVIEAARRKKLLNFDFEVITLSPCTLG